MSPDRRSPGRRADRAILSRTGMALLVLALDFAPAMAQLDSSAAMPRADVQQMWQVRTGVEGARRVRLSSSLGTFEAARLRFSDGQPVLLGLRGAEPPRALTWADVRKIDALHAGKPSGPSPPGRGSIVIGALLVVALTVVPAIGANDAVEYSERYWASVGILFGTGIVIGVPAYHLSSHWHTVYVPTRPVPEP